MKIYTYQIFLTVKNHRNTFVLCTYKLKPRCFLHNICYLKITKKYNKYIYVNKAHVKKYINTGFYFFYTEGINIFQKYF